MRVHAAIVGLSFGLAVSLVGCPGEACTAETCAGCCAADGTCQAGHKPDACGRGGAACGACSEGAECVRQRCVSPDGGVVDGGTGGGAAGGCLIDGRCGAQICNVTAGACEPPLPCPAANGPQPAGCGLGLYCAAGLCLEAPRPSCDNFALAAPARRFDPRTDTGPVLLAARPVSFAISEDGGCPPGSLREGVVELEAYDRQQRFGGELPRLLVYRSNMVPGTVQPGDVTQFPSDDGGTARLRVRTCTAEAVTSLVLGYAFEGGNGMCVALPP